jgi:Predicted TIM-barrel enzyme, possibly a dioxygenase
MMWDREQLLKRMRMQINASRRIIAVAAGNGMFAKLADKAGADLLLALTSGRFRQMGRSSMAGMLPFANGNNLVMEFAMQELLPLVRNTPIVFGLCASDPTIDLEEYIRLIRDRGFAGIANYPSFGTIDGKFREALEENGLGYEKEIEAIRIARRLNMLSVAFVFNETEAERMVEAGADIISANLGLTKGGELGAKKVLSLEAGVRLANRIFQRVIKINPDQILIVNGGPVTSPIDLQYVYNNTEAAGYLGGSSFERLPSEQIVTDLILEFKTTGNYEKDKLLQQMLDGVQKHYNYVDFVKDYVADNYMNPISFSELAMVAHVSRTYLSTLFKKEVGCTFPEYLAKYRIGKATEIMKRENLSMLEIAQLVGFNEYAHFSKTFKKITGLSPKQYRDQTN